MADARSLLLQVFERDQALSEATSAFLRADRQSILAALQAAATELRGAGGEEAEAKLVRIATLLADLEGAAAARLGVDLLDAPSAVVRAAAGEALLDIAVDDPGAVLDAVTARTNLARAMTEAPYLLVEIGHGRSAEVLTQLLAHADPAVVAAAIDALGLLGDPAVIPALRKLERDTRVATVAADEENEEESTVPLAALATEAIDGLRGTGAGGKPRGGGRRRG